MNINSESLASVPTDVAVVIRLRWWDRTRGHLWPRREVRFRKDGGMRELGQRLGRACGVDWRRLAYSTESSYTAHAQLGKQGDG